MTNALPASGAKLPPHSATSINVAQLVSGDEGRWDEFVTGSPSGTFFHLSGWRSVVKEALGWQSIYLAAYRGNDIRGVLPVSRVRSPIFGDCLVSMPLGVYGGICADDQEAYSSLLRAGSDLAHRLGVKYLELRNRTDLFPTSLPGRKLYVTFTQDLSPGAEKLMQGLPRDTRYAIRKAQKAGLEWTEDVTLAEFYDIYAQNVHRLGTPVFPRPMFDVLRNVFRNSVRLFGVRKDKKLIASVLCFYFQDQVLPYYAGSLQQHYRDCPSNFMYWKLIDQSCREGLRQFDFGRSKLGTGSCDFKSAWSMRATELPYRYLLVKAREVPHLSPIDKKFQLPVAAWRRMPFWWTKVIGPRLIRWIPSI